MSEFRDVLNEIVGERQSFTGDLVKNLRTGIEFIAEIEEVEDIALNVELGRDARESVIVHVLDRNLDMRVNDRLQVEIFGLAITLQVLGRRKDNPASPQVDYGCMKVTDKDS